MMKNNFILLILLLSLYSKSQTQYISYFTPPSDFSEYSFLAIGPDGSALDNFNGTRKCKFSNGPYSLPVAGMYFKYGMLDLMAQTYASQYDSIVFKFKVKSSGYAKNFRIRSEFLINTGNFPYSLTRNFNLLDSMNVRFKVGYVTLNYFSWKLWLEKQDTTLNNFTISLSDLDIKGYLHYETIGLNEISHIENKINYNNEMLFFDEKWLNKKYWISDLYGKEHYSGIVNNKIEKINLENGLYILTTEYSSQKMIISKNQ